MIEYILSLGFVRDECDNRKFKRGNYRISIHNFSFIIYEKYECILLSDNDDEYTIKKTLENISKQYKRKEKLKAILNE